MEDYILEEEEEECIVLVKPPSPSVLISLRGSSNSERGVENSTCVPTLAYIKKWKSNLYPQFLALSLLCYVAIASKERARKTFGEHACQLAVIATSCAPKTVPTFSLSWL